MTTKHQNNANSYTKIPKNPKKFICECGKKYTYRQGLYTHKQKCNFIEEEEKNVDVEINVEEIDYKKMFLEMMKLQEKQHDMIAQQQNTINEMIPKIGNNNTTNNNQFNLQMFLNEDCKNAQNITDFMKSIQVNLNDLIQTGKLGYVEGMSRIFVKALKDMDVTERPFHCTDIKRETVYIKDQDKWSKDEDDKIKIKRTIRNIENKNFRMIPKWQEENPDCMDMESKKSEELTELSITALGGDEERCRSEKKIMKNVLKEVMIDKK